MSLLVSFARALSIGTTVAVLLPLGLLTFSDVCPGAHAWNHQNIRSAQQQQQHHQQKQYHHPAVLTEPEQQQQQQQKSYKGPRISSNGRKPSTPMKKNISANTKIGTVPLKRKHGVEYLSPSSTARASSSSSSSKTSSVDPSSAKPVAQDSTHDAIWRPPKLRYYAILGVEPTATCQQIKTNYRKLAKIYHPGKCVRVCFAAGEILVRSYRKRSCIFSLDLWGTI